MMKFKQKNQKNEGNTLKSPFFFLFVGDNMQIQYCPEIRQTWKVDPKVLHNIIFCLPFYFSFNFFMYFIFAIGTV
ncbi:unnamed protein product [Camellia sinensis]